MNRIKVAGCALNQTPFDWAGNRQRIVAALAEARRQGAAVVCLPELCITGYGCEDAFFNPHVQEKAVEILFSLLAETRDLIVSVGLPIYHRGALFNATAMIADGRLLGLVPKKSLAGDGVHYEPRWFRAWEPELATTLALRGQVYPFGDLHFNVSGLRIGFEICEEAWVAHRPGIALARRAVDVILNPSASHFAFGKIDVRKQFVREGSRAFNVGYVYSNLLGNEAGRIVYDGGVLIADNGQLIAQGPRFSFRDVLVTSATIDVGRNRVVRARTTSHRPELAERADLCIRDGFVIHQQTLGESPDLGALPAPVVTADGSAWDEALHRKEEEFTRAVALGLFDFLRKSRQNGFVVSLSGGLDSAAVTLLCRVAFDLAASELGLKGLKEKLAYSRVAQAAESVADLVAKFVTCAYQGTENSSRETQEAARAVAREAGAVFHHWSVEDVLGRYRELAEGAIGERLSWDKHDITLQNIQARARGPAIWMLANLNNALLLATSNRSEAAVGYATMDGDTCGGISPIGGIDKAFLRSWARWMMTPGPHGLRAFPSLEKVLAKPPTAELRPQDRHQTDEDDLMPYDILDAIERLAIRDKKSPAECYAGLKSAGFGAPDAKLKAWTVKFFRLWCRSQWKRERYAPAFHLDDESLDPKTWCRFPILSSGFEEELMDLERSAT